MHDTVPPRRSFAVSVIGWLTLLLAALYATLAGMLLFIGVAAGTEAAAPAKPTGWEGLGMLVAAVSALVGIAFLLLTSLGIPAGLGVLMRRQWGRILTFIFAPFAILTGIGFALGTPDELYVLIGVAQILYGFFAILIMALGGADFRRRAARVREDSR
jgi:hypothetical protein